MRIISRRALREFWERHPQAEAPLRDWEGVAKKAVWRNITDVRRHFPHADATKVASGHTVTVFNIAGNKYRLIAGIHYDRQIVHTLMILTHAEYDKDRWKE